MESDVIEIMNNGNRPAIARLLKQIGSVRVEPVYPRKLYRDGIEGWVKVEYTITKSGKTTNVRVIESQPLDVFDRVSINAVKQWRFDPRKKNGKAVEIKGLKTLLTFEQ